MYAPLKALFSLLKSLSTYKNYMLLSHFFALHMSTSVSPLDSPPLSPPPDFLSRNFARLACVTTTVAQSTVQYNMRQFFSFSPFLKSPSCRDLGAVGTSPRSLSQV